MIVTGKITKIFDDNMEISLQNDIRGKITKQDVFDRSRY